MYFHSYPLKMASCSGTGWACNECISCEKASLSISLNGAQTSALPSIICSGELVNNGQNIQLSLTGK